MKNDLTNHLKRLQSLTSNYELLQGYPIAMLGLLFILEGISVMIWGGTAIHLIYSWLFLPSLALLAITLKIAIRYHRRKFGMVKASMEPRRTRAIIAFAVLYLVLIVLGGADFKHLKVALEPTLLNAGIILVLLGLLPGFPWRHYAVVGLVLAAIAFLPAFHVVTVQQFWHGWSFMAPGIAFLLCGAIDRLIFMRSLQSLPAQEIHA
jgi:uncharacterized membrane protein required for colicin V production